MRLATLDGNIREITRTWDQEFTYVSHCPAADKMTKKCQHKAAYGVLGPLTAHISIVLFYPQDVLECHNPLRRMS